MVRYAMKECVFSNLVEIDLLLCDKLTKYVLQFYA